AALVLGAVVCLRRKAAEGTLIVMAILLFVGVVVCFVAAAVKNGGETTFKPAFSDNYSEFGGTFTIFALAPWAFVGFESISHSAHEAKFKLKRSFAVMAAALAAAAVAYIFLALLSVVSLPEGCSSWREYVSGLDKYSGVQSQPAFFSAYSALGNAGSVILGVAAMGAMFTGIIGNYIALSRLLSSMSNDGLSFGSIGKLDKRGVPRSAILTILGVSVILPFFGRTAISWIVDVTTVGATIAFAFVSGSAFVDARKNKKRSAAFFGAVGLAVSLLFAVEFLVPNITAVKTLSTESYLILAGWGILGFIVFNAFIRKDKKRLFGRSSIAWIVLLGLIIFTSTVWMRQTTSAKIDSTIMDIGADHVDELDIVENSFLNATIIQVLLIVTALAILFIIYSKIQKRERQTEIEKAMAEENSRAKTSFLSNMSHEIRTPMNAIIGLGNITLRDPDLSPQTRENLEKIGSSARHLLGLINDILDMSRIESGRMVLKQEEFSFKEIIGQVNIIINGQCLDKGLTYEFVTRGLMKDYYIGDDMKLKQVLINILGNAVKFTPEGGTVRFIIEEGPRFDKKATLKFIISDTGIGMSKEYLPHIFEAFSQEDSSSTNRYGSTGLGMPITKSIVELMNGHIEVESEKGKGSVFTVTVTLGESERKSINTEDGDLNPHEMSVLVIDDDRIALEHAEIILGQIGIGCDTAESG
ncbi:MAG: amino acid permease, partial [Clostridia bacterium]|nr:amino acid permease [Clostridia bacterium]